MARPKKQVEEEKVMGAVVEVSSRTYTREDGETVLEQTNADGTTTSTLY